MVRAAAEGACNEKMDRMDAMDVNTSKFSSDCYITDQTGTLSCFPVTESLKKSYLFYDVC